MELSILVTRPKQQAQGLITALHALGARVDCLPTIDISPMANTISLQQALHYLPQAYALIFTSANAVDFARSLLPKTLPKMLAIGSATQKRLQDAGWPEVIVPPHFNSEGLLALPDLQAIQDQHIIIFGGKNPRSLLSDTLTNRGAIVHYAVCYERVLPSVTADYEDMLSRTPVIIVTSNEALQNLFALVPAHLHALLQQSVFVVASARIVPTLQQLNCKKTPIIADNATDSGIIAALLSWYKEPRYD